MAVQFSTYNLDPDNNPFTDGCAAVCDSGSTIFSGFEWTDGPEIEPESDENDSSEENKGDEGEESEEDEGSEPDDDGPVKLAWGQAAPTLTSGECENVSCSECRWSWNAADETNGAYRCKDETVYQYRNKCGNTKLEGEGNDLCMLEEEYCHWSFPAGDPLKNKSEHAACRSVPRDYWRGSWEFGDKESEKQKGMCKYDCKDLGGKCYWSWPMGEEKQGNPKGMYRCQVPH